MASHASESAFNFLSQGALISEFQVDGSNIVLGFPEASLYKHNTPYFGETIGRTTNRVRNGKIENLDGKTYQLATNDGPNCLHGGSQGWGKKDFTGPKPINRNGREGVEFTYVSKDGEENYPGTVECRVWYTAGKEDGKTVLDVEYEAELTGDECSETVVGVTNHSYFTMNPAAPTIEGTQVILATDQYLELDSINIPTGKISRHPAAPSANVPFELGAVTPSFDDCFVLDPPNIIPLDTRTLSLRKLVTLSHPATKLHLEVLSTEPAFQFYTGEGIDVPELETSDGERVAAKRSRAGIAIEPSRYVDAPRDEWRGQCLLKKGETWGAKTQYRAWKE